MKATFTLSLFFIALFLFPGKIFSQQTLKKYEQGFKAVDSLAAAAKPKDALERINQLNAWARKEKEPVMLIKSVLYRMLFQSYLQEDAFVKILSDLQQDIRLAAQPQKSVLQSLLAETYWKYFQQNLYRIRQRTSLEADTSQDIRTWSVKKLAQKTVKNYMASLAEQKQLKALKTGSLKEVLSGDSSNRFLRPTLYDLLAHRALDAMMNTQMELGTTGELDFNFNQQACFAPAKEFSLLPLAGTDSTSFARSAIEVFQGLLQFHLNDQDQSALADADLKRLKFMYNRSLDDQKEKWYMDALEQLAEQCKSNEIYADVLTEQALLLKNKRSPTGAEDHLVRAVELARKAISAWPGSIGDRNAQSLVAEIEQRNIQLELKEFILPAQPAQLLLKSKNVDTIWLKLYKVPVAENDFGLNYKEGYQKFLKRYRIMKTWSVILPVSKDYREHSYLDKMDALPLGHYVLIAQNRADTSFKDLTAGFTTFKVTRLSVEHRVNEQDSVEYLVRDSKNGQALKNVNIQETAVRYSGTKRIEEVIPLFSTNTGGYALSTTRLNVSKTLVTLGKDSVLLEVNNYRYTDNQEEERVLLFTDRPIYRPGQTLYYKGLFIENENGKRKIRTAESLELVFKDANNKEIEKVSLKTNDYGTFQGSFTIPQGKMNGRMSLNTEYGSVDVQVEEYKRPGFEITFEPAGQKYKLGDSIRVDGKATAFSGYAIGAAAVKYVVYRSPFNRDYTMTAVYGSRAVPKQVAVGKAQTDQNGKFHVSFLAAAEGEAQERYSYQVKVEVTDPNGETISGAKTINAGKKDMVLYANLQDRLFLRGTADSISFMVSNLNGGPVKAVVKMEWTELLAPGKVIVPNPFSLQPEAYSLDKAAFQAAFPGAEYKGDANPMNWEKGKMVLSRSVTVGQGSGNFVLDARTLRAGYYKVRFVAENMERDTLSQEQFVRVQTQELENIQLAQEWLMDEKTSIAPNETAVFRLAGLSGDAKVYYEVYHKGTISEKVWLNVSPKQSQVVIRPKPNQEGDFSVQFSMVQNGKIFQALKNVEVIDPSRLLDIHFLSFRDKLQPGEKESWTLKITSRSGEKQMAELLATLYDASLDQLKAMDWPSLNKQDYDYNSYTWQSRLNTIQNGNGLWFLGNYGNYYRATERSYEQVNLFGYNYYGGYNSGYQDYLARVQKTMLTEQAVAKLEKLKKEGKLWYGVVTDEQGYGMPGVALKSGNKRTTTDASGIYVLDGKAGETIEFRFIGYLLQTVKTGKEKRLDVRMKPDGSGLNEVVVTGYGAQKKASLTGSVIKIRGLTTLPAAAPGASMDRMLMGSAAGVAITPSGGSARVVRREIRGTKNEVYDMAADPGENDLFNIAPRTNFNETAFFYPQLLTNDQGEIQIDFTIPQSLTRYKMMGFAHTKDLKTGFVSRELITQKELAIAIHAPRFFREGDTIVLAGKLNNLSGKKLTGNAVLEIKDALSGKPLELFLPETKASQRFNVESNGNEVLKWTLKIPAGISALSYKVLASSGSYSDGEEMTIPVLPNAMLVTESMPINVRGNTDKTFTMEKLLQSGKSKTLRHQQLTLEFTSNPVWYAVQALPYLMEYPYECAEQTFSRFYANSFASGIINSSPKIKAVFQSWQQSKGGTALLSNLEKNQELKSILLEESPWVREANNETERKKRLAVLFDLNRMSYELKNNFSKLEKMQLNDGSFPWFNGMRGDRYITQHIVLGLGQLMHLKLLNEKENPEAKNVLNKAIIYLDGQLKQDYQREMKTKMKAYLPLHYLYARSYSKQKNTDPAFEKAKAYYLKEIVSGWKMMEPYQLGQAALVLQRNGNPSEAMKIIELLRQRAQQHEEMGMYWANNRDGWWWYQNSTETQALLIEAFDEVASDKKAVEEMKIWLLKNKQGTDWKTTKATAAACYALLSRGYNLLDEAKEPEIKIGGKSLTELGATEGDKEAGTGYRKLSIPGPQIAAGMGKVSIHNPGKQLSWGALYWQYFEQLDKITSAETGVKINKQLFVQEQGAKGPLLKAISPQQPLKVGDLLKVRVEIRTDRDMEYVHLKDMRSAGFEPVNVISAYKYQDGLGYYESTKDASTNFFIAYLRKGVYVFEYGLRVSQAGQFSNGITSLQCMYAPEFTAHSQGVRLSVKP